MNVKPPASPLWFWDSWFNALLPRSAADDPWWSLMVAWLAAGRVASSPDSASDVSGR